MDEGSRVGRLASFPIQLAILLLLLKSHIAGAQKLQQYCKFTPQHTLCRTTGLSKTCGQSVPARGVTERDAAVIVAHHNQLRARVALGQETKGAPGPQPMAANMMEMAWDEELSLIAQRHADQCVFEHECADCRQVERFGAGQNLFISFESDKDPAVHWPRAMQAWFDEVALFSNKGVDSYSFEPATGHYTQFVWADTRLIGCGFTMYEEGEWFKKLYTCNYGPTGNIIFSALYRRGQPCSACPAGTSCSLAYPGLCDDDFPNASASLLASGIATTTPLPDFVFVGDSSEDDLVLLFPSASGQFDQRQNDVSQLVIRAESTGINTKDQHHLTQTENLVRLRLGQSGGNDSKRGKSLRECGRRDDDCARDIPSYDDFNDDSDYDDSLADYYYDDDDLVSNEQLVRKSSRLRGRRGSRKKNFGSLRSRNNRGGNNERKTDSQNRRPRNRAKKNGDTNNGTIGRIREKTMTRIKTDLIEGRTHTSPRNRKRADDRTNPSFRRNRFSTQRRHRDRRKNKRFNNRRKRVTSRPGNRNRTRLLDYDDISDEYPDYISLEDNFDLNGSTEFDFDYNSDEISVEEFNPDDYDFNLGQNRNAALRRLNDTDTLIEVEAIAPPGGVTAVQHPTTIEDIFAGMFDVDDVLAAFNASDMTNIAALMTFFNNQDLFRMLKDGQTHRKTFNRLVTQLTINNISDADIASDSLLKHMILDDVVELPDSDNTDTNESLHSTVSNDNPKGAGESDAQSLGDATDESKTQPIQPNQTKRKQMELNQRNQDTRNRPSTSGGNNRKTGGNAGKSIQPGRLQPFQIIQPADLLEASGLRVPPRRSAVAQVSEAVADDVIEQQRASADDLSNNSASDVEDLPKTEEMRSFLLDFGKTSEVIRTNSLDSVKAIINSLPPDSRPLVFFRSNMGTIRQLSNLRLADSTVTDPATTTTTTTSSTVNRSTTNPNRNTTTAPAAPNTSPRRTIRSTLPPAMQLLEVESEEEVVRHPITGDLRDMLLSCRDVTSPCPVVALAGHWTHGRDMQTNVVRSVLAPSAGGQLVLGQTIPPPASTAACVSLSHTFEGHSSSEDLPQLQVSVWPLGQVLLQEDVSAASVLQEDGWRRTEVSFAPIRSPFMVVLTVEPNPGPDEVEVALRGFMVVEGLC